VGRLRFGHLASKLMPRGPLDAARQWLLFAGAYYLYRLVRGLVDGHANVAYQHARDIVDFERDIHAFVETDVQQWALHNPFFINVANWMYVNSHFLVTTTFLIWLYIARNHAYYFVRNMFLISMVFALIGYLAFPAAPPRFLPEWGFQDTVADFFGNGAAQSAGVLYNPYAAVPSMHVAFALMISVPAIQLVRHRVLKVAWAFYPLLVTFVVIATGNHFWLDAALGAVVAGASALLAVGAFGRARPEAWAWRTAPVEAQV
jgi:membrane-associated phospholipid phosphatase